METEEALVNRAVLLLPEGSTSDENLVRGWVREQYVVSLVNGGFGNNKVRIFTEISSVL